MHFHDYHLVFVVLKSSAHRIPSIDGKPFTLVVKYIYSDNEFSSDMKILVVYHSLSGQTEKIANAIHEACRESGNHETKIIKLKDTKPEYLNDFDLVFIGAACHDSALTKKAIKFMHKLTVKPNYKVAGFYTHSTLMADGTERNDALFKQWAGICTRNFKYFTNQKKWDYLGEFHCMGMPNKLIKAFIHKKIMPDEGEWQDYLKVLEANPPTEEDCNNAKKFAKDVINSAL